MSIIKPLFGGAIEIKLPQGLVDVSFLSQKEDDFREVPDHQEVFASETERENSVVIELNELNLDASSEGIAKYHFQVILDEMNAEQSKILEVKDLSNTLFPWLLEGAKVQILKGQYLAQKGRSESAVPHLVLHLLAIFRLPNVSTDILINYHQPLSNSELEETSLQFESLSNLSNDEFMTMVQSLNIKDWNLFN